MSNTNAIDISVSIYPVKDKGNLRAWASLGLSADGIGNFFAVNGVKVLEGKNGLFIAMPQSKDSKGGYHDVCLPTTADFRKTIVDAVLSEYGKAAERKPLQDKMNGLREQAAATASLPSVDRNTQSMDRAV